jgi:hypothetical protein
MQKALAAISRRKSFTLCMSMVMAFLLMPRMIVIMRPVILHMLMGMSVLVLFVGVRMAVLMTVFVGMDVLMLMAVILLCT